MGPNDPIREKRQHSTAPFKAGVFIVNPQGGVDELIDVARMACFKADLLLDPKVYLEKPDRRDH
jgi:hypothetical protein